eukprot:TRINITY_DN67919_c6_g1_i1.p2 TRINITY_DN67919_c6_g1~~TRINITY_DN67919_c6_g1_i1.p2  ORF type:complete len:138 (+),score=61.27 TRINITY_DN67919_c6_g1_i1:29-442(+)
MSMRIRVVYRADDGEEAELYDGVGGSWSYDEVKDPSTGEKVKRLFQLVSETDGEEAVIRTGYEEWPDCQVYLAPRGKTGSFEKDGFIITYEPARHADDDGDRDGDDAAQPEQRVEEEPVGEHIRRNSLGGGGGGDDN